MRGRACFHALRTLGPAFLPAAGGEGKLLKFNEPFFQPGTQALVVEQESKFKKERWLSAQFSQRPGPCAVSVGQALAARSLRPTEPEKLVTLRI